MSREAVQAVIRRSMTDEQFLDQVLADPDRALGQFSLTEDERAALVSREHDLILEKGGRTASAQHVIIVQIYQPPVTPAV